MQYIRQGATHKVVIGPAVAVGDGFTPVTTLDLSTADEAEAILHDNGTVVSISAYTLAAITGADGYYHLTLQSGISGTVGHLTIVVNDDSLILPLKADFCVIEEAVYDALYAASANAWSGAAGSSIGVANATQLAGQTITAAAGVTFPTSVASPTNITAGTITTVTNLTNAPTNGDLTAAMKASVNAEADTALADAKAAYAVAIEAAILNEGDATALLAAISAKVEEFLINEGDSTATMAAIASAVWSAGTRVLTAGTNIVLAKGTGVTGFNDLSAAQVNAEADTALADYDGPTNAEFEARTIAAADYATNTDLDALILTVGVAGAGLTALAQASVCTELRLAELDAANLPADIDQLKADNPNRPARGVQLANLPFLMVDETDFATPETGVTVTATISKDGGAFSACANAAAEIGNGVYKITLTSGEMTADVVVLKFTGTGCAQTTMALATQPT